MMQIQCAFSVSVEPYELLRWQYVGVTFKLIYIFAMVSDSASHIHQGSEDSCTSENIESSGFYANQDIRLLS